MRSCSTNLRYWRVLWNALISRNRSSHYGWQNLLALLRHHKRWREQLKIQEHSCFRKFSHWNWRRKVFSQCLKLKYCIHHSWWNINVICELWRRFPKSYHNLSSKQKHLLDDKWGKKNLTWVCKLVAMRCCFYCHQNTLKLKMKDQRNSKWTALTNISCCKRASRHHKRLLTYF